MKLEIDFPLFSCKGTTNIFINQIIIHFLYNCNFSGAVAAMVSLVVENAELAGGYSVDWCLGVDDERSLGGLLQSSGKIFGGVADFEGDVGGWDWEGEPVEVVDGEGRLVGGGGVVAVGDVEDVVGDVFFDDEPGTTGEAHTLALADGVEPEAFVLPDATPRLEFDDIARVLAEVATDIVVVVDFSQEADALGVLALGIDQVLTLCNLTYLIFHIVPNRENGFTQLPVVDLRQEIGLILDRIRTGDKPLQTCLIDLCLGIVASGNEVVVMSAFFIKRTELDESVAHDIGVGGKACPHLLHRVARDLFPVFAMTVDDLEVAPIFMGHSCRHLEILFRGAVPRFLFLRTNLDIKTIRVEAESGKLIDHHTAIDAS